MEIHETYSACLRKINVLCIMSKYEGSEMCERETVRRRDFKVK